VAGQVSLQEVPSWVRERLTGTAGTTWIGIDGLGASGKSTVAVRVAAELPGAVVVPVDDFAHPDVPTWQRDRFVDEVLTPLLAGRPGRYRPADLVTGDPGPVREVPVGVPVIVEGVSATDVRLGVPWDVTLWLEVAEPVRRRRIAERDPEELLQRWRTDWWPQEEAYVRAQRPAERVDAVVVVS
jgi:uridine kinase